MTARLEMHAVTKRFGGLTAVGDVSLSVERGRVHGLIGPNGAGKSTTIGLLTGFLRPTSGTVKLDGADARRLDSWTIAQRGISRTFQHATPLAGLSVLDNVLVGMHRRFSARAPAKILRQAAIDLVDRFGLAPVARNDARTLTFGQLRFLEIARALAMEPDILLLDEPAAGLNDAERRRLRDAIDGVRADGTGVLLIDHDVPFVFSLCDELTVMNFGSVIARGTPEAVRADPAVIEAYLGT